MTGRCKKCGNYEDGACETACIIPSPFQAKAEEKKRLIQKRYREKHKERLREKMRLYRLTHTKEIKFNSAWNHLHARCRKRKTYKNIKCEWKSFAEFKRDMWRKFLAHNKRYGGQQTTIERIDNDGNYSKENCKWATRAEQAANQRHVNPFMGRKTCMRGHRYTEKNTHIHKTGGNRVCRKCNVRRKKEYRDRRSALKPE